MEKSQTEKRGQELVFWRGRRPGERKKGKKKKTYGVLEQKVTDKKRKEKRGSWRGVVGKKGRVWIGHEEAKGAVIPYFDR